MNHNDPTPFLRIEGVHKFYGADHILRGIDLSVRRGEVVCILGRSGSGKSTLLRTVNALEPITAGRVILDGSLIGYIEKGGCLYHLPAEELARQRARIGMVFQHFNLFPHMTVLENITMAPQLVLKQTRKAAEAQAMELLEKVGLADKAYAYPASLSGGQQQRVAIARALAMRPELILFDEPTSALDPELVGEVLGVMRQLASEGMTMLIVTHELRFARDVSHKVVLMHEGRVAESGPTSKVMSAPRTPAAKTFFSTLT
ncbi:polar amino acid transport system ATP-binding protein [Mesorhizobium soli]|uniref:amino acid ABC transporter ATP-binding protein n=1 Tax=Pseudaminobacter soli (ex Li et al. 2025) TaxID=1295366 RepID=UPI002475AB96|nr:amino acid ABC transporter ATP-binding protein [Mesorhizobium soli]MDH6233138.1 polar amino acid transport system ATP-binding protein [Mesorhizobium soli]